MKKLLFLLAVLSLSFAEAQNVKGILIFGMNTTQIDGDEIAGYKHWGLNGGVGGMLALTEDSPWNIGMEVLFSQKGSKEKYAYEVTLPYAEVPLLLHFEDRQGGFTFGTGLSYGRLIKDVEAEHSNYLDSTTRFLKDELAIVADIRFKVWKQLKFNIRFQYSLMPIRKDWKFTDIAGKSWTRDAYNNALTFRLLWVFNEKEQTKYKKRRR